MLKSGSKLIENQLLSSVEETFTLGQNVLGKDAQVNDIFCFFGPLGVGKTTVIKGIAAAFCDLDPNLVTSPTFSLLNIYEGLNKKNVYHFDLYRLERAEQFFALGFEEYLTAGGLCCIEWSERIESLLNYWPVKKIYLSYKEKNERYCEFIKK